MFPSNWLKKLTVFNYFYFFNVWKKPLFWCCKIFVKFVRLCSLTLNREVFSSIIIIVYLECYYQLALGLLYRNKHFPEFFWVCFIKNTLSIFFFNSKQLSTKIMRLLSPFLQCWDWCFVVRTSRRAIKIEIQVGEGDFEDLWGQMFG